MSGSFISKLASKQHALGHAGVPYAKRCHEPEGCTCEGCTEAGRPLFNDSKFLDCCALVRHVARTLQQELGFRLGPMNQAYQASAGQPLVSLRLPHAL
jgi:hypothetical protein